MKTHSLHPRTLTLLLALASLPALAPAQSPPVYESHDKSGPVFSDQATPGAAAVNLPPPNVIQTAPVDPATLQPPPPPGPPYSSLAILSPVNGGTVHTNTGAMRVQVQSQPALRNGDRFQLSLDGNLLPAARRGTDLRIRPTDWRADATDQTAHTLELAIVDRNGNLLMQAPPVQFYAHRATVGHR
jgi:hypothetical protein